MTKAESNGQKIASSFSLHTVVINLRLTKIITNNWLNIHQKPYGETFLG